MKVLSVYPQENYATPVDAIIDIGSDQVFKCPSRKAARGISRKVPTFLYSFNYKPTFSQGNCMNVAHTFELEFVWPGLFGIPLTPREQQFSLTMVDYWTTFAHIGNASYASTVNWPPYNSTADTNLIFDLSISTEANYRQSQCDLWDTVGYWMP